MSRRHSLPAEVYALVEHTPATVLLEGGKQANSRTRRTTVDAAVHGSLARVRRVSSRQRFRSSLQTIESAVAAGQFAAGFFSYECGNCFEPKAAMRPQPRRPAAGLVRHLRAQLCLRSRHRNISSTASRRSSSDSARRTPSGCARRLRHGRRRKSAEPDSRDHAPSFALTETEYAQRIAAIHEWIRAGDVYQLNFTAPFRISRARAALPRSTRGCARGSRSTTARSSIGSRASTFSRFRRSCSFASIRTARRAASPPGP